MPTTMHDNRQYLAMTVDEADELFRRLALEVINRAKITTNAEKTIATIKARTLAQLEPTDKLIARLERELTAYISAHPERFASPRNHKTSFGTYGLRTVSKLVITDRQAVIEQARTVAPDCCSTEIKLDKAAVEKAVAAGLITAGAALQTGEIATYKISRTLLDAAGEEVTR